MDLQKTKSSGARNPLSCTSCRQRKIKCDRFHPCDHCLTASTECVFPTRRPRARREKLDARQARDAELLQRIKHLEGILADKMKAGPFDSNFQKSGINLNSDLMSLSGKEYPTSDTVDGTYATFIKEQASSSRHLNTKLWSNLSSGFEDLRQLIEEPVEDEDDIDNSGPPSTDPSAETTVSPPHFILQDRDQLYISAADYPSDTHRAVLWHFFFTNVDPICKMVHRPTVNTYYANTEKLLDPSTGRFRFSSFEAVTFAGCFAAVNSMSTEECLTHLGEQKEILLAIQALH